MVCVRGVVWILEWSASVKWSASVECLEARYPVLGRDLLTTLTSLRGWGIIITNIIKIISNIVNITINVIIGIITDTIMYIVSNFLIIIP